MDRTKILIATATDSGATLAERHDAFGEIVRLYQDLAVCLARGLLCDPHLAEEAAQRAFISAWRQLERLRESAAFPAWLKRIVATECNRLTRGGRPRAATL